jgi:hypothetical protein
MENIEPINSSVNVFSFVLSIVSICLNIIKNKKRPELIEPF